MPAITVVVVAELEIGPRRVLDDIIRVAAGLARIEGGQWADRVLCRPWLRQRRQEKKEKGGEHQPQAEVAPLQLPVTR